MEEKEYAMRKKKESDKRYAMYCIEGKTIERATQRNDGELYIWFTDGTWLSIEADYGKEYCPFDLTIKVKEAQK